MQFVIQTHISSWACPISPWIGKDHFSQRAKSFRRQIWSRVVTSKAEAQGPALEEVVAMQKSQNIKGLPAISKFSGHPPHTEKLWGSNRDSGTSPSLCQHFILFMKVLWTFRSQNIHASGEDVYMPEYVHFKPQENVVKGTQETCHCAFLWRDWWVTKRNFYYLLQMLLPSLIFFQHKHLSILKF